MNYELSHADSIKIEQFSKAGLIIMEAQTKLFHTLKKLPDEWGERELCGCLLELLKLRLGYYPELNDIDKRIFLDAYDSRSR